MPRHPALGRSAAAGRAGRRNDASATPSSAEAASTSASASSAIGASPGASLGASRCVTSSRPTPGSRHGMWLTDARPASTVRATKHQPQRGRAIPVAIRTLGAASPDDGLECPVRRDHQRPAVAVERPAAAGDDLLAPARRRRLDEHREREVTAQGAGRHRERGERAAGQVLVAAGTDAVDRRRHEDLLEPRSGRVRVAVDEPHEPARVPVVIRADHEPDGVARCGAQAIRVAEEAEHPAGRVRRVGSGRRRPRTPPRTRARARRRATDGSRAG